MNRKVVHISEEKNCAWCEFMGAFVYGKNKDEIIKALHLKEVK